MSEQDQVIAPIIEAGEDVPIAEDEVISAARSCSAIFVIIAIVGAIACIALGIALAF